MICVSCGNIDRQIMKVMRAATVAVAFCVAAFSSSVFSADKPAESAEDECATFHKYAATVMDARQAGVAMPEMMEIAGDSKLLKHIVVQAYKQARFGSEKMQKRQVDDFANDIYLECFEAVSAK